MLKVREISKKYRMGETEVCALNGVSLEIESGDFVAIMGPSGSGKSTLMHILGLLDVPSSGSYQIDGHEVSQLREDELAVLRREMIGFIFQQFHLLPRMSAVNNVALPLLYSERKPDQERASLLLEKVGLSQRKSHTPSELSGGQQQRVAIARSLIHNPQIIFADEPTGNLDSTSEREILALLKSLNQQGITVIIVTHEEEIGAHAKRRIRMRDGVIQSDERLEPALALGSASNSEWRVSRKTQKLQSSGGWLRQVAEHFRQGFQTLAANKVRTSLSMLGILIGVGAVVAMLAIGTGAQKAIEAQLSSLGSNLLVLRPGSIRVGGISQGAGGSSRLTYEDARVIEQQIAGVSRTSPSVLGMGQLTFSNQNWNTQILGVAPSYAEMRAATPEMGRFFTTEENLKRSRVAVLGMTVVRWLFGDQNPIGEMIKINKVIFQVIGILPEKGGSGFRDQDDVVVIPVLTAMRRVVGKSYIDYIDIEAKSSNEISRVQDKTLELMKSRHRVLVSQGEDAFQIFNMTDIQSAVSESSRTMSILLASIAAISLLVGGIGIMNIMLVSVTERTREIGLRKAVGARRSDILSQFLVEAIAVSAVGGAMGITLGWIITTTLSWATGWATSITLNSVLLAFIFSTSIGVIFGIYPARQASRLHPIDALRHE